MSSQETFRYSLTIQYDGAPFHGWQLQRAARTVQGELEAVLRRITEDRRRVVGSGRTDRGVHALGQVASVDVPSKWTAPRLRAAVNALLPDEIWLREVRRVPPDFHPRYDAVARTYQYRLGTVPEAASPFHARWCWDASESAPDRDLLEACAALIPGERDFGSFAKAGQPERGTRCQVTAASWSDFDGLGYRFSITANRYLHHMVRYLVGTMADVGRCRRPLNEMRDLLASGDSVFTTSPPAPPEGLFLARVEYPPAKWGDDPDRDPNESE